MNKKIFLIFLATLFSQEIDIEKIKRIKSLADETNSTETLNESQSIPSEDIILSPENTDISESDNLEYFGYNFFEADKEITIFNNIPAPDDYFIGAGDEIIIHLWGDTQLNSTFIVSKDGTIYIQNVGLIKVAGYDVEQLKKLLFKRFSSSYSTVGGKNPTTFLEVSIGSVKSINVSFIGQFISPGVKLVHPFSDVILGIIQAGGIKKTGTLRNIQIIRNSKVINFDFYSYNFGKTKNFRLRDGDIVKVKSRASEVTIKGEVYDQGIYELIENENLNSLLVYAGGVTSKAKRKAEVIRVNSLYSSNQSSSIDKSFYVDEINYVNFQLSDGDLIKIKPALVLESKIYIYGQSKTVGEILFVEGMTVKDVLFYSVGVNDSSYIKTMDLENAEIIRRSNKNNYPEHIKFSINEVLNGSADIQLQNWDMILIRKSPYFNEPEKISILGEVKSPGQYTLIKKEEKLSDLIKRSGGLAEDAFEEGIRMFRDSNQIVLNDYEIVLMDRDSIYVPKHSGVVKVSGSVFNEGLVQYIEGKSMSYYIESAGGYTPNANKANVVVVYANGDVKIKKFFSTPTIKEGCHVIVYDEDIKEPFDTTEFLKEIASILASLATIFYIITN